MPGTASRYASRKELESWEVLDPREFAIFQGGLAISMMEEGFALQADGLPLGGILRMVRTGIGCEKGYWRRFFERAGGIDELEREVFRMASQAAG